MLTRDDLLRIALRHDTSMSRAMLRALGVDVPRRIPRAGAVLSVDRYADALGCMAQRHGVRM